MYGNAKYTDHDMRINSSVKFSFGIGTLHGNAGGSHLFSIIYLLSLSSNLEKVLYMLIYVIGAFISTIFFIVLIINLVSMDIPYHSVHYHY